MMPSSISYPRFPKIFDPNYLAPLRALNAIYSKVWQANQYATAAAYIRSYS